MGLYGMFTQLYSQYPVRASPPNVVWKAIQRALKGDLAYICVEQVDRWVDVPDTFRVYTQGGFHTT